MRIDRVKLIAEMARQDITVKELSDLSYVSCPTITAMRRGKNCSRNSVMHVARALNVRLEDLQEG